MGSCQAIAGATVLVKQTASARRRRPTLRLLVVLGDLVQTTAGKWITHPPTRCPNGHPLGPNQVLVGHVACLGHGGGHTTWTLPHMR